MSKKNKAKGRVVPVDMLSEELGDDHGSGAYALPRGSSHGAPEALGLGSLIELSEKPTSKKYRKKEAAAEAARILKEAEAAKMERKAFLAEKHAERMRCMRESQPQQQTPPPKSYQDPLYDYEWMYGEGPNAPKFFHVEDKKHGHGGTRRTKSKSKSKSKSKRSRSNTSLSRAHR